MSNKSNNWFLSAVQTLNTYVFIVQCSTCEYSKEPWPRLRPVRTHMLTPQAHSLYLSLQAAASSAE